MGLPSLSAQSTAIIQLLVVATVALTVIITTLGLKLVALYSRPLEERGSSHILQFADTRNEYHAYEAEVSIEEPVGDRKMVPIDSVMRGGSIFVGATSVMSMGATFISGAIIIQPIFALMLLVASVGFYVMSYVKD